MNSCVVTVAFAQRAVEMCKLKGKEVAGSHYRLVRCLCGVSLVKCLLLIGVPELAEGKGKVARR